MSKKELCKDEGNARRRVLFSDFSENDLVNIENYILFELCNPSAADHIVVCKEKVKQKMKNFENFIQVE